MSNFTVRSIELSRKGDSITYSVSRMCWSWYSLCNIQVFSTQKICASILEGEIEDADARKYTGLVEQVVATVSNKPVM